MTRRSTKAQFATDADLRAAIRNALAKAGLTLEELEEQARRSRFSSEAAHWAWFVVTSVRDHIEAA